VNRTLLLVALAGCAEEDGAATVELQFHADPQSDTGEAYLCFAFDVSRLGGADIQGLALDAPSGPVTLHHVALFASPDSFPDGPTLCETMPAGAVPLNVWALGGGPLVLPDDIALVVPSGTQRLVVQTHALRYGDGPAHDRTLTVTTRRDAARRAGWMPLRAPTPALRPHHREESTTSCTVRDELHVISTWPHMHQHGAEFVGSYVRAGASTPFVHVQPWDFEAQRAYPLELALAGGDQIETHCIWQNDTDATVLPGPSIYDEMCGQSLMAWPVEAAHCE
jgi:hypothetical protein